MEEIIRTTKTHSFIRSEVNTLAMDVINIYLKENGIPLRAMVYITVFDNMRSYITISIFNGKSLMACGQICIYIEEKTSDYAFIYGLYVSPEVRRRKYAELLVKIAEAVISILMFEGSYLEATPGTWMVDWYKRLGYEPLGYKVDETTSNDIRVLLRKQLS